MQTCPPATPEDLMASLDLFQNTYDKRSFEENTCLLSYLNVYALTTIAKELERLRERLDANTDTLCEQMRLMAQHLES